jgi:hypothetical protein
MATKPSGALIPESPWVAHSWSGDTRRMSDSWEDGHIPWGLYRQINKIIIQEHDDVWNNICVIYENWDHGKKPHPLLTTIPTTTQFPVFLSSCLYTYWGR